MRVGLVGYGMAGREIHAPLIRAAGLQVAAVVTRDAERAAAAAAENPGTQVLASYDDLLARPDLDLVVLATPTGGHADEVCRAVDAGRPVVVDKPMATSAVEAARVVRHAAAAGVPFTVFQNRRFDVEFSSLLAVIDSGALGGIRRVEARWERFRPVPKQRWREQLPASEGGGVLADLGPHLLDWAVTLLGPITEVDATVNALTMVGDDDSLLFCRHAGGGVSTLSTSSLVGAPGPWLRVLGERAAYLLGDFNGDPNLHTGLADAPGGSGWLYRGETDREPVPRVGEGQVAFYRAVAAALGSADPQAAMPVDPRDAVHTMAVIDAARRSSDERRGVPVETPQV